MAPAIGSGFSHPLRPRGSCSRPYIRPVLCVSSLSSVCSDTTHSHRQQELAALSVVFASPAKNQLGKATSGKVRRRTELCQQSGHSGSKLDDKSFWLMCEFPSPTFLGPMYLRIQKHWLK